MEDEIMLNKSLVKMIGNPLERVNFLAQLKQKHSREDGSYEGKWPDYTDPRIEAANPHSTLQDIWRAIAEDKKGWLDGITGNNSDTREDAFWILSDLTGLPYEFFYYVWLGRGEKAVRYLFDD